MQVNTTYEPFSQEPEYIEANKAFVKSMPVDSARRVLDLACGTAMLTEDLLELRPDATIVGIDLDPVQIDIARKQFEGKGVLVEDLAALDAAAAEGRGAVLLKVGRADDLSELAENSFDHAMIGNAIHLMPSKEQFLREVHRVLKPGGTFAFSSVFFIGTFSKEAEVLFSEWMKEAVLYLNEKNAALRAEGKPTIPRKRGTVGKAFDKDWMSPEQWSALLSETGYDTSSSELREVRITKQGLQAVGAYGGLSEVLMSGYPVEVSSECLQEGAKRVFEKLNLEYMPRYWLEIIATKR